MMSMRSASMSLAKRCLSVNAPAMAAAPSDPIQALFVSKIQEYATKKKAAGGDFVDSNEKIRAELKAELERVNLVNRNIAGLTMEELDKLSVDMVLMSPPCQPHTRQGHKKDTEDPRSSPLSHLVNVLPKLKTLSYLLLENVSGFEKSHARNEIKSSLEAAGFECQEYLLCPRQIGIPNSRLRYYLLAKKEVGWAKDELQDTFINLLPKNHEVIKKTVGEFLDEGNEEDQLEDKVLLKRSHVLDIVTSESSHSCCFTSGYTRYCEGTGSVIQQKGDREEAYRKANESREQKVDLLKELKMRYFSTKEVARLMGFPSSFTFPSHISRRQKYKALGNSINVIVVSHLIRYILQNHLNVT